MRITTLPSTSKLAKAVYMTLARSASQSVGVPLSYDEMQKLPSDLGLAELQWIQKFKDFVNELHTHSGYSKYFARFHYSDAYAKKAFKIPLDITASNIAILVFHAWESDDKKDPGATA